MRADVMNRAHDMIYARHVDAAVRCGHVDRRRVHRGCVHRGCVHRGRVDHGSEQAGGAVALGGGA